MDIPLKVEEDSQVGGPQAQYFRWLEAGEWRIQRCTSCARAVFYPRVACPHCGSPQLDWFRPSGAGTVYSTTSVSRKDSAGGNYNVALVDLDEGPRMMSRIEGMPPEAVRIGMRVKSAIARLAPDGPAVLVFHAAEATS